MKSRLERPRPDANAVADDELPDDEDPDAFSLVLVTTDANWETTWMRKHDVRVCVETAI